jgi:hypothetical protein
MRTSRLITTLLLVIGGGLTAWGQTIVCEGVLANSGAAGHSLVRFRGAGASGLGVACDRFGSLWDRGGTEALNRYAPDGRLLAHYRLPKVAGRDDQLTLAGDTLVLKLNGALYTLAITAPDGSEVIPLKLGASAISSNARGADIALAAGGEFRLLDVVTGAVRTVGQYAGDLRGLELAPDGALYAVIDGKLRKYVDGIEVTVGWPKGAPGERAQFIDGHWYGHTWHGTIRRFDAALQPAPGVVLGGSSGSFIGKLDGNYELSNGRGMAKVADDLFAVSGATGVLHLLQWGGDKGQMALVRRIGPLAACRGIALDGQGNIWSQPGRWTWDDGPDAPLRDGANMGELTSQAVMLSNDTLVALALRYGSRPTLVAGPITTTPKSYELGDTSLLGRAVVGVAVYPQEKSMIFLGVEKSGKAYGLPISTGGSPAGAQYPVTLTTTPPVKAWTSLAMKDAQTLLGAADGWVIELAREGVHWKETRRWSTWGEGERFGAAIYLCAEAGRLWVSDRERHRILVFSLSDGRQLSTFGHPDTPGTSTTTLQAPETLIARGQRAVLFDSGNQRLLKLSLR